MDFKEKVVWITGASSGIGEHLTYAFAEYGAKLIISSRNEKELQRVKKNCRQEAEIYVQPLDLMDIESMPSLAKKMADQFGFINILINNGGISQRALVKETQIEVDKKIMTVNFLGTIALTKAILPFMIRQQFGQIVVISSVLGKIGVPYRSAYAASKHALHGYFDSLRAEIHQDNIKVTIICPGYVFTNVTLNALKGDGSKNNEIAESTRNGMEPDVFAQKALRAIAKEKEEILIGGKEIMGPIIKRIVPKLWSKMARKMKLK